MFVGVPETVRSRKPLVSVFSLAFRGALLVPICREPTWSAFPRYLPIYLYTSLRVNGCVLRCMVTCSCLPEAWRKCAFAECVHLITHAHTTVSQHMIFFFFSLDDDYSLLPLHKSQKYIKNVISFFLFLFPKFIFSH